MVSGCAAIVGADGDADVVRPERHVAALDLVARPVDHLIADGRLLAQRLAAWDVHEQIAAAVHLDPLGAVEADADGRGVGARRDQEVVLEALLVAVELEVDAVVDAGLADAGEQLDAQVPARPVGADDMVDDAGQRLASIDAPGRGGSAVASDDGHRHRAGRARRRRQAQRRAGRRQGDAVADAARREADALVELAVVGLEAQRQLRQRFKGPAPLAVLQGGRRRRRLHPLRLRRREQR